MMPAPMPMMPAMGTVPTIPGKAGLRVPGEALGAEGGGRVLLGVQMAPGIKSQVWPWHLTCFALHSHDGPTTAAASASQSGLQAAGSTAAELYQPAGNDLGNHRGWAKGLPRECGHRGQGQRRLLLAGLSFPSGPADDDPGHESVSRATEPETPAWGSGLSGCLPGSTLCHGSQTPEADCTPEDARESPRTFGCLLYSKEPRLGRGLGLGWWQGRLEGLVREAIRRRC